MFETGFLSHSQSPEQGLICLGRTIDDSLNSYAYLQILKIGN